MGLVRGVQSAGQDLHVCLHASAKMGRILEICTDPGKAWISARNTTKIQDFAAMLASMRLAYKLTLLAVL